MPDLILRESKEPGWFDLQLRNHDMAETRYFTLATVDRSTADAIIDAGPPMWLTGRAPK